LREPIGITAHIVPWNGPLWIGSRTIPPALAAGNAVIAKPSREAPLTMLKLAELAAECGLPAGVFNVITGESSEIGDVLTGHPDVGAVYFTGSDTTGRRVLKNASERAIPAVMELGGKSPNIIFADANLEAALHAALWAIFANAGQICVAGSRLIVQKSIHAEFVGRLTEMARGLRLGGPRDRADLGPLISAKQRERVLEHIEAGRTQGKLRLGGAVPDDPALQRGYYVQPTIFDEVPPAASIAQEEIFGPVLAVTPFETMEQAIEIANHSRYGLAAAVWTRNGRTAQRVAEQLESGQVYINHYFSLTFELSRTPYKSSGFGHSEGPRAIDEFLRTKTVTQNLQDPA
jgi:acyl-CoA reductase-like NAD-dependent aldehyde dehydrogenase